MMKKRNSLVSNIIGICHNKKGLDYQISERLSASIDLRPITVKFKAEETTAYVGNFDINFNIPNLLSIGRDPSRGFGTIMRLI